MRSLQTVAQLGGRGSRRTETTVEPKSDTTCRLAAALCLLLLTTWMANGASAKDTQPKIGDSEKVFTFAPENTDVRGLAWDGDYEDSTRLFVLDHSGKIFTYSYLQPAQQGKDEFELLQAVPLLPIVGSPGIASPRGLAFTREQGHAILYFLDWANTRGGFRSRLWRYDLDEETSSCVDLSSYVYRIGDREVYDLAYDDGQLLVSYDASGYADQNRRVQRGILRIQWEGTFGERPKSVQTMPDAGVAPARGLAVMHLDDAPYLWGTNGNEHIYCAELLTGRGLFFFDRPTSHEDSDSCWGICFGHNALWVSEHVPGPDRVHRVNVTENLNAAWEGPPVPRRLIMSIQTEPESDDQDAGVVHHYYSRPYGYEQLHSQGIWVETESITDQTGAAHATIRQITHDPAGDEASRQVMQCVEYANAPAKTYSSQYEIDLWTNPYKTFVYPHRANRDETALAGMNYLADDPVLYNLNDVATYEAFVRRVREHIAGKYGVEGDMQNPYWAARNVVEYIQDNYYYPHPPKRIPATVDYSRQHYDANPANLKIELSAKGYDKSQIIACSGTSVMVTGAMRHLGIPARWLGTGTQQRPVEWDKNENGLLDPEESAPCSNGHRYTQVWLGNQYGWICFDATPSKPPFNDYDPPPPLQPQWRYMTRAGSGHRENKRIVFNIGSEFFRPLYRNFEYDASLAVDNNCGGDQRYNLQGRTEKPELWKLPRHRIQVKNLCYVDAVVVGDPGNETEVTWQLKGAWHRIDSATLSVCLQQYSDKTRRWQDIRRLAKTIPCDAAAARVDLSGIRGEQYRIIIRRDGDSETGGTSAPFDLD
jgi:hypothetical protein